jgi:hypothetical protein
MAITRAMCNGLRPSTESDIAIARRCYGSAVSLSAIWNNSDDTSKVLKWDSDIESYIAHRSKLIDEEGCKKYLPWNIYNSLNLNWIDGYAYAQTQGDCCSFGHRNSLKASNLTNSLKMGITPKDTAQSVCYAIARGDGSPNFGDGLNLNPMAAYAAEIGNFWSDDFGRYNGGGYVRQYRSGSEYTKHALETQSVICQVPDYSFNTIYNICSAGIGINMGTGEFPSSARVNNDELAIASGWSGGGHSMAFIASWKASSGKRYIYLENSHGAIYAGDSLHPGNQYGCWLDESLFERCGNYKNMYGDWYMNIGEITKIS